MKPVNTGLSSFLFLQTVKNVKEISDVGNLIVYKTSFYAKKTKNLSKIVYKTHFYAKKTKNLSKIVYKTSFSAKKTKNLFKIVYKTHFYA